MLLLVFSPDIIPQPTTTISHINFQYYSVFLWKETITFTWPSFVLCNVWTIIETTLGIWSCTGFNLDRKTSIKVGDLRWSELQINFTDRGRNIWYNEEINWSFKLLSFNHSETGGTRGGSCDGYKKLRPSSVVLLIWKKCFIDGCCLADKHWDSGQKYKVEEIYYYIIILYNRKLWYRNIWLID